MKDTIAAGLLQLQNNYKAEEIPELITEINEKETINGWNAPDYALINSAGKKIAGSLPVRHYTPGWQVFNGPPEYDDPSYSGIIYARAALLPGGYSLVVGEDGEFIEDFGNTIVEAFTWGAIIVIGLGISCGFYLSRSFLRKIQKA